MDEAELKKQISELKKENKELKAQNSFLLDRYENAIEKKSELRHELLNKKSPGIENKVKVESKKPL